MPKSDPVLPPRPASLPARLMAFLIDGALLTSLYVGSIAAFFLIGLEGARSTQPAVLLAFAGLSLLLILAGPILLSACYFLVLHATCGQTLGKMFMGIRVVGEGGAVARGRFPPLVRPAPVGFPSGRRTVLGARQPEAVLLARSPRLHLGRRNLFNRLVPRPGAPAGSAFLP